MQNSTPHLLNSTSYRYKFKQLISRLLSRFEPANSNYERRLQALEGKWLKLSHVYSQNGEVENRIEDKIYKDFEINFRGSSELIIKRLKARYGALLKSIVQEEKQQPTLLDLGCGHGEFLELGKEVGFATIGVDQSSEAVSTCKGRGHQMIQGDLLAALKDCNSNSLDLIGFFHVIEHCSADYTIKVFKEAWRILKSGGLFLVETPSLYSLWASSRQFYLDPSHTRPIHPDYIQFVAGSCGFKHGEVREFGKVEHPEACDFNKIILALNNAEAAKEIEKLDKWLYGPMDLSCTFKK